MVELVDTLSWGGSGESCAGSSPALGTIYTFNPRVVTRLAGVFSSKTLNSCHGLANKLSFADSYARISYSYPLEGAGGVFGYSVLLLYLPTY